MIQLFVSDMDGTLLDKHAQISPRTVAAIHRAQAAGVMFAVATGRSFAEATNVLHAHHIHCPLIAVNGAAVYDEHQQLVSQSPLPRDVVDKNILKFRVDGLLVSSTLNAFRSENRTFLHH